MSRAACEPVSTYGTEDPFACIYCGRRTESMGPPKTDASGERYLAERCLGCGQVHHFYEWEEGQEESGAGF